MKPLIFDPQSRLVYYGNIVGYAHTNGTIAAVDPIFRSPDLEEQLQRLHLQVEWEEGLYDRLISGTIPAEQHHPVLKRCKIWQLKPTVSPEMHFIDYDTMLQRFGTPKQENYALVYDGQLGTNDLEEIFEICNLSHPQGYSGHSLSMSDVVELFDADGSEFFYCDRIGFRVISFANQAQTETHDHHQEPSST